MTGDLDFSTEKLHTEAAVTRLRALLDHATDSRGRPFAPILIRLTALRIAQF